MKFFKLVSMIACLFSSHLLSAQGEEINTLVNSYYGIKNALVADDGKMASSQAEVFLKALNTVSSQQKVWKENVDKLKSASEAIAKTTEVPAQRAQLNDLSTSFFQVLKAWEGIDSPVFYQYCPMKKAYWLSGEKEIKNPYYGSKMLSCGKVVETID